eukprot:1211293-Pleurochrysis_carterae.AAC.3
MSYAQPLLVLPGDGGCRVGERMTLGLRAGDAIAMPLARERDAVVTWSIADYLQLGSVMYIAVINNIHYPGDIPQGKSPRPSTPGRGSSTITRVSIAHHLYHIGYASHWPSNATDQPNS